MILRQVTHDDLGCASYLIGDDDAGVAAVVDPRLDIDEYLRLARYLGVSDRARARDPHPRRPRLRPRPARGRDRRGRSTSTATAGADYAHEPFDDGWELVARRAARARAAHARAPARAHRVRADRHRARSDEPWAVLTGDSLFVGDIARPDLAVEREEGARGIFRSLPSRCCRCPTTTEVWPGHLGGSLCGGPGMDMKVVLHDRLTSARTTSCWAWSDEDEFVRRATGVARPAAAELQGDRRAQPRRRRAADRPDARPLTPRQSSSSGRRER